VTDVDCSGGNCTTTVPFHPLGSTISSLYPGNAVFVVFFNYGGEIKDYYYGGSEPKIPKKIYVYDQNGYGIVVPPGFSSVDVGVFIGPPEEDVISQPYFRVYGFVLGVEGGVVVSEGRIVYYSGVGSWSPPVVSVGVWSGVNGSVSVPSQ